MNAKLILFDIDKTLISKTKLSRNPWKLAIESVFEVENSTGLAEIDTHGKTFKGLAIEVLKKHNIADEVIAGKLDLFLTELGDIYAPTLEAGEVFVFDGVNELLSTLNNKDFCVGLITGNTRGVAFDKLRKGKIDTYFEVGGFGEDSAVRDDLVDLAVARAKDKFGVDFKNQDIFVIGDTPLDISSAKTHGLQTIGVATGVYSKKDLVQVGSNFVLDNLDDTEAVLRIISR